MTTATRITLAAGIALFLAAVVVLLAIAVGDALEDSTAPQVSPGTGVTPIPWPTQLVNHG